MELREMIDKRKSVRSYTSEMVDIATLQKIKEFMATMTPLYPEIRVRAEIVERESVSCFLPWVTPQMIAIFSEEKEGYAENVGFLFQQLDLYLQNIGLGTCWLGMGRLNAQGKMEVASSDDLKFVILMTVGYPKGEARRNGAMDFKRKSLAEISDQVDERLEPARLAPSSVNSQPWYFVHEGSSIHVYCVQQGFFRTKALGEMNRIDIGIALAHLYVSYPETFRFFHAQAAPMKGYHYLGSIEIG